MIILIPGSLYSLYLVIFLFLFLTLVVCSLLIPSLLLVISLLFLFLTFTWGDTALSEGPPVNPWKYYSNFSPDNFPSLRKVGNFS